MDECLVDAGGLAHGSALAPGRTGARVPGEAATAGGSGGKSTGASSTDAGESGVETTAASAVESLVRRAALGHRPVGEAARNGARVGEGRE